MRFEFKVKTARGETWTQLQGNGGQIGNGCLYLNIDGLPEERRESLLKRLLAQTRRELKRDGVVYVWKGDHLAPADRIEALEAQDILEARYIGRAA